MTNLKSPTVKKTLKQDGRLTKKQIIFLAENKKRVKKDEIVTLAPYFGLFKPSFV